MKKELDDCINVLKKHLTNRNTGMPRRSSFAPDGKITVYGDILQVINKLERLRDCEQNISVLKVETVIPDFDLMARKHGPINNIVNDTSVNEVAIDYIIGNVKNEVEKLIREHKLGFMNTAYNPNLPAGHPERVQVKFLCPFILNSPIK